MKKILLVGMTLSMLAAFSGCSEKEDKKADEKATTTTEAMKGDDKTTEPQQFNVAGWIIDYEESMIDDSLENASTILGYGEVETSNYSKTATEGMQFCLIKLKMKKDASTESIKWDNMELIDNEGTEYTRMEDEFISDLGMKRLPGTDLNFGENEGWIAFEVSKDVTSLELKYEFNEETLNITIK